MIIALAVICILTAFLFCPVCVNMSYLLYKEQNVFTLKTGLFVPFITLYKSGSEKNNKQEKNKKDNENGEVKEKKKMSFEVIKNIISEVSDLFAYFKKHLSITNFKLHFHIGTGDAALTGITSGAAWGALYDVAAVFANKFKLKDKNLHVCPNFSEKIFECDINVRLSVKVLYVLIFAVKTHNAIKKLELF